jgi:hypothetical protein
MKNVAPISATTLDLDEPTPSAVHVPGKSSNWWVEVLSLSLLIASVVVGLESWKDWFSSVDRIICSVCVALGLGIAFIRSSWSGEESKTRLAFALAMWALALAAILMSVWLGRPRLCGIACGLALAGWCTMRVLGENVQHGMMLGLVFAIPTAIDAFAARGAFDWLESIALNVTSGLADAASLSHVRVEGQLIFGLGVADRFFCEGKWDSVVSFFGIAIFCILAFRRNLLAGAIAIVMSAVIWIAVRASAWVWLASTGIGDGVWYDWSFGLEVGLFLLGAILVVSIDQFISALLEPIPFEFINTDFPLFAFIWNWLCALPTLTVNVPQRESDFGDIEDDVNSLEKET